MSMHGHSHHDHGMRENSNSSKVFWWSILLNTGFILIEISSGIFSGSVALIADAVHNLSDVFALLIAWGALLISKKNPQGNYTYGYRSATILSVLVSTLILFIAVGGIVWSAVMRIGQPVEVQSITMMVIGSLGIVINGISALLLSKEKHELNARSAFLHLLSDAVVSAGVVVAALIIYFTHWSIIDPLISLVISAVVLWSGWGILKDALKLALNATPDSISLPDVKQYLQGLTGVSSIHDIHIWSMSTTEIAMTGHLVIPSFTGDDAFLHEVCHELKERFGIGHCTIQIEKGEAAECELESDTVI